MKKIRTDLYLEVEVVERLESLRLQGFTKSEVIRFAIRRLLNNKEDMQKFMEVMK